MAVETLAQYDAGGIRLRYQIDRDSNLVGLSLLPISLADKEVEPRATLTEGPEYEHFKRSMGADRLDPLVHGKLIGQAYPSGFASGHSMHGATLSRQLKYVDQSTDHDGAEHRVVTRLQTASGLEARHVVTWRDGVDVLHVYTELTNNGDTTVTLEHLTAFCLGGISPFAVDDAPGRLVVHRARTVWSAEGRLDSQPLEALHLERTWAGHGRVSERFGQVGSMPVRRWFPFVAVEDTVAGATWAAQLAWAGSWQLEILHQTDSVSVTGGHADREFGHWHHDLAVGATCTSPTAILTVVAGDVDAACHALTSDQQAAVDRQPAVEQDLPVMVNEYCTTWGKPAHDLMMQLADALRDSGARYLVIDAGWYAKEVGNWGGNHGDWIPNTELFPNGIKATADGIRERGLIPGLWFEMETLGPDCETAKAHPEWLLQRDGHILSAGGRRFWDLRRDDVQDYLAERVIGLLRDAGFGYIKVDYNDSIGLGCDGAESLGEGLRQQVQGSYRFWQRMRRELPELVIENCSSGGHRLEPSMMALASQASFSDAHETREIPIVAANVTRFILPRQNQIWAVLHPSDDDHRFVYLLAAGFLGRLCLSGELLDLTPAQWDLTRRATALYAELAPIIKHGRSHRFGPTVLSYRHPQGWQAIWRVADDGRRAFAVVHSFGGDIPDSVDLPIGDGWEITDVYTSTAAPPSIAGGQLQIPLGGTFRACVVSCSRAGY